MRHRLILTICALTAACAAVEPDPIAETAQPIIGGEPDTGKDLGLPLIIIRDPQGRHYASCSGSMITRKVVMTAAHCSDLEGYGMEVWFADAYNVRTKVFSGLIDDTRRVAIAKWVHPMWKGENSIDQGYDIALLALDKPIPDSVVPLAMNRERVNGDRKGQTLRIAGFGDRIQQDDSPDYIKMTAKNVVSEVNRYEVRIEGSQQIIASGDSGGPAFLTIDGREVVAGISSYGISFQNTPNEISAFTRVDLYLPEIDAFIAANDPQAAASCGADGACGYLCGDVDPDCPCVADGKCATACAAPDRDPDCPLHCLADSTCTRTGCAVKDPDCGEKPLGDACGKSNECASDLCVPADQKMLCAQRCGTNSSCPSGYSCATVSNICLPDSGGGCAVAPGGGGGGVPTVGGWLALALAGLFARRRR